MKKESTRIQLINNEYITVAHSKEMIIEFINHVVNNQFIKMVEIQTVTKLDDSGQYNCNIKTDIYLNINHILYF